MFNEKQKVALGSVLAALFLTVLKVGVGIFSGSLGILSEAAHSALDLGAAAVTLFAVRLSDKPADREHHYGHGKIESFSALIETLLLLATCIWIIYEAAERLFFGKATPVMGTFWGIAVMVISIIVNLSRARALKRIAQKYGSQALEADALHFDSDVWSSLVVIGGLACVMLGQYFKVSWLNYGDAVAALGVSALVIWVSFDLGKRTIDVLLDTAPKGMLNRILHEINGINGVLDVANIRIRPSGGKYFIDLNVGIDKDQSHHLVHHLVHHIRERIEVLIPNSDIIISTFPVAVAYPETDAQARSELYEIVKKIVAQFANCSNIHNIHVYQVAGEKFIAIHLEVREMMSLKVSHQLSHQIEELVMKELNDVKNVSVHFEYVKNQFVEAEDVTAQSQVLIGRIDQMINSRSENLNCHDIKVYSQNGRLAIFLHCELDADYTTEKIESVSKEIKTRIREGFLNVDSIYVHVEPQNESTP